MGVPSCFWFHQFAPYSETVCVLNIDLKRNARGIKYPKRINVHSDVKRAVRRLFFVFLNHAEIISDRDVIPFLHAHPVLSFLTDTPNTAGGPIYLVNFCRMGRNFVFKLTLHCTNHVM